jgi:uncharacterized heparinase superfamily protein
VLNSELTSRASNLALLLRTLSYLRWEQIAYRPLRWLQFRAYRHIPALTHRWTSDSNSAPSSATSIEKIRAVCASLPHLNQSIADYESRLAELSSNHFTFLNRALTIAPFDWNRRYEGHLWNYQLHYFSYAVWCARAFVEKKDETALANLRRLVLSWIAEARPGSSDGWDAYPVSLRLVNWIYAYTLIADRCDDRRFLMTWSGSIRRQLDFLRRHLEYHLLANHILKNAKALVIGGLFCGDEKTIREGERLLWREMKEQFLSDGGHYERAPMYHALSLADLLECFALLKTFGRLDQKQEDEFGARLRKMAAFLSALSYQDGRLALFNDSANTEEARPQPILDSYMTLMCEKERSFPLNFPQSGYYLWISADRDEQIIVDAGPPSVDYNTAHAHCDLLSYELRVGGRPLIVDTGVHGYANDPYRAYSRSTRAHNTVVFDGHEQSEIWGTFRIARRAEVIAAEANGDEVSWEFRGSYRLAQDRALIHERRIARGANGEWTIADSARGNQMKRAESFIHLHPDVWVRKIDASHIECLSGTRQILIESFGVESMGLIEGWHFPDFGVAQKSTVIRLEASVQEGQEFGYRIRGS